MIKKNRNHFRVPDHFTKIDPSQLRRDHPTLDGISQAKLTQIDSFASDYRRFLDRVRIAPDVVEEVIGLVKEAKFFNGDKRKGFLELNLDGTAFALVKFGSQPLDKGINIFYSHTDSPCLRTKVNPLKLEWDPDLMPLHTGVELSMFGYGGIFPHQWAGKSLDVRGYAVINRRRRKINFSTFSPETSLHVDTRQEDKTEFSESHTQESLNLVTGYSSIPDFLKSLGFKSKEDFSRAVLYAVPDSRTRMVGPYIVGYGHDDRSCLFASVKAFLEVKHPFTSIIIGFDKEEVGSYGNESGRGKFFEHVLGHILQKSGRVKRLEDVTIGLREEILRHSLAVNADVDVGSSHREMDNVDQVNVSRLGYGVFLNASDGIFEGDQISPALVDEVMGYFGDSVVFQPIGSPLTADRSEYTSTINELFFNRGIKTINIGIPASSLHSPEELIHKGDLYNTFQAYKLILERKPYRTRAKAKNK